MKRRRFFKTLAALPVAPALIAQAQSPAPQTPAAQPPAGGRGGGGGRSGGSNIPTFDETSPELVADAEPRFFTPAQFSALRRLSALLMPPLDGSPGALECGAPEFLDFLIGASLPDRQKLYRSGLDTLNANAKKSFKKAFADLSDADADTVVRPLLVPVAWFHDSPKDPAVQFVVEAHRDIRTATQNSREWATAGAASGRRRGGGGGGAYLNPIDPIYRS
ncbi:MAG: gluconate 2-dehydrogenase subunit 3 family protein [Bryobacteraceae bacterium]|jgi:hypothetical protein